MEFERTPCSMLGSGGLAMSTDCGNLNFSAVITISVRHGDAGDAWPLFGQNF